MIDKIIFPFNYKEDNKKMFVRTFQLAELKNAKVVLFTTVEEDTSDEKLDTEINLKLDKELDNIYFHLFELNGFFQTYFNKWKQIGPPVERVIRQGDLRENLFSYLSELKYPVKVVVNEQSTELNKDSMEKLVKKLPIPPTLIK